MPGLRGTGVGGARSSRGATCCTRARCPTCPMTSCGASAPASWPARARADIGTAAEFAERDRTLAAHRGGSLRAVVRGRPVRPAAADPDSGQAPGAGVPAGQITLICIGEYPGIAHFGGLGELTSEQLGRLPATAATTMTGAALEHADPRLGGAARARPPRLGTIARHALARAAIPGRGLRPAQPRVPVHARRAVVDRTAHPRRGRRGCRDRRRRLRAHRCQRGAAVPRRYLVLRQDDPVRRGAGPAPRRRAGRRLRSTATLACALTDAGRRVLDGQEDHVALNGVDRWIGGVHCQGSRSALALERGDRVDHRCAVALVRPAGPRAPSARRGPGSAGCR